MTVFTADEAAQLRQILEKRRQLLLEEICDDLAGRVTDLGVESVAGWI